MHYEFVSPPRVIFGWGRRTEAGALAKTLGRRAFIISGSRTLRTSGRLDEIRWSLRSAGLVSIDAGTISREPQVEDVDQTVEWLRSRQAGPGDLIVAIGGGSALDLGKAAAALATNTQSPTVLDYLEGVGRGLKLEHDPLPVIAIPTTGGTGSEATKNAVISSENPPFKKSLRSERMVPRIVLLDPELAVSASPEVTAWTGMDALTQLIESYISRRAQPIPRALALQGIELAGTALLQAYQDGTSRPARERMAHAAFLSGLALANSGLGMAHGLAAALGIHCQVPHGLACAMLLPVALRVNRPVCEADLARIGCVLTGKGHASVAQGADAAIARVDELCATLNIPRRLSEIGVSPQQHAALVAGSRGNSMDGNPRALSDAELLQLLAELQ